MHLLVDKTTIVKPYVSTTTYLVKWQTKLTYYLYNLTSANQLTFDSTKANAN